MSVNDKPGDEGRGDAAEGDDVIGDLLDFIDGDEGGLDIAPNVAHNVGHNVAHYAGHQLHATARSSPATIGHDSMQGMQQSIFGIHEQRQISLLSQSAPQHYALNSIYAAYNPPGMVLPTHPQGVPTSKVKGKKSASGGKKSGSKSVGAKKVAGGNAGKGKRGIKGKGGKNDGGNPSFYPFTSPPAYMQPKNITLKKAFPMFSKIFSSSNKRATVRHTNKTQLAMECVEVMQRVGDQRK